MITSSEEERRSRSCMDRCGPIQREKPIHASKSPHHFWNKTLLTISAWSQTAGCWTISRSTLFWFHQDLFFFSFSCPSPFVSNPFFYFVFAFPFWIQIFAFVQCAPLVVPPPPPPHLSFSPLLSFSSIIILLLWEGSSHERENPHKPLSRNHFSCLATPVR